MSNVLSNRISALSPADQRKVAMMCMGGLEGQAMVNPNCECARLLRRILDIYAPEQISPSTASVTAPATVNGHGRGAGVDFAGVPRFGEQPNTEPGVALNNVTSC